MLEWLNAGIAVVLTALIFIIVLGLARYLAPKKHSSVKSQVYECGIFPVAEIAQFNIRFFVIAIIFTLFDIEALFMYPWAVDFKGLGILGVVEMFIFLFLVFIGWIYAYKKGALEWL